MQMKWAVHFQENDDQLIHFLVSFALVVAVVVVAVGYSLAAKLQTDCYFHSDDGDGDVTDGVAVVGVDAVAAGGAVAGVVVVGDADDDVKCYWVAPFDSNRPQDGALKFVMAVASHFVVSRDYEYFAYFLNDHGQMRHAIHLNGVYLNVLAVNGFAWDSKWARYLSNVSNCFGLKHFASYFGLMLCARVGRMRMNQLDVRHVHCDVLDDDVGWLKVNPEDCPLVRVNGLLRLCFG